MRTGADRRVREIDDDRTARHDVGIVPAKKVIAVVHIRIIVAWPAEQIVVA